MGSVQQVSGQQAKLAVRAAAPVPVPQDQADARSCNTHLVRWRYLLDHGVVLA